MRMTEAVKLALNSELREVKKTSTGRAMLNTDDFGKTVETLKALTKNTSRVSFSSDAAKGKIQTNSIKRMDKAIGEFDDALDDLIRAGK